MIWLMEILSLMGIRPQLSSGQRGKGGGSRVYSLSKSYNMPGWRVGFAVGNAEMLAALARLKSYFDYGVFQPIQIAGIIALNDDQQCVHQTVEEYRKRRDALVHGLKRWVGKLKNRKGRCSSGRDPKAL